MSPENIVKLVLQKFNLISKSVDMIKFKMERLSIFIPYLSFLFRKIQDPKDFKIGERDNNFLVTKNFFNWGLSVGYTEKFISLI